MTSRTRVAMGCALALLPVLTFAQSKPPVAQFWMDVATNSMSIPGMGDTETGMMGMLGGAFGGTKMGAGGPGLWLDTALHTRLKPDGTEGTHAIPTGLKMGKSLPLIPVVAERSAPGRDEGGAMEKPQGKLLFYWGCGEKVKPGQPRVVDFSKANPEEWGRFMSGRFAPDRGAKSVPGRSVWPNERNHKRVPNGASLQGDHAVSGEGVPVGLRFGVGPGYDFMPKIRMTASGDPDDPVNVSWQSVDNAQGYFLSAMGAKDEKEMIIWSSSEQPDPGWGLMDYVPPAQVKKLIGEKVVLAPSVQACTIPKGIFGDVDGASVRMIAYGPELNLVHPPQSANLKAVWEPEWAVRVRIKSTGMTMLGMGDQGDAQPSDSGQEESPRQGKPGMGDVLKGIFGR